ncbi:MAG: hypothetical protein IJ555_08255 [Ruminococcus sp.]|nr:hypothetical protein [Ruminococcus sp.]
MKKLLGLILKLFIIYCCFAYAPLLNVSVTWKEYFEADGVFMTLVKMLSPTTVINDLKTARDEGSAVGSYFNYYKSAVLIMGLYYISIALAMAGKAISHNANVDLTYSYRVLYYNGHREKISEKV